MRGLSERFMRDLTHEQGKLREILDYVHGDDALSLEIREDYINIYYRGGSLYKISAQRSDSYAFQTDVGYFIDYTGKNDRFIRIAGELYAAEKYLEAMPFIKAAIDRYIRYKKSYGEKEVQQQTVYENNRSPIANSTHYYIADFEYENAENKSRFDLTAIKWKEKRSLKAGLCVMEVKLGYQSVNDNGADIAKHLDDAIRFFNDDKKVEALKGEAVSVFNQKQELGLISPIGGGIKKLNALNEKPEFMLWLVNYPLKSTALLTVLNENKEKILGITKFDFIIASSSFAGYGLFADKVISIKDFMGW